MDVIKENDYSTHGDIHFLEPLNVFILYLNNI